MTKTHPSVTSYKFIFFALLLTFGAFAACTGSARAQESTRPIKNESFYNSCISKPDPVITNKSDQKEFCACLAAHKEALDLDRRNMSHSSPSYSRKNDDEVNFIRTYSPCIYIPIKVIEYNKCLYDQHFQNLAGHMKNLQDMCSCIASGLEIFARQKAVSIIETYIQTRPDMHDPMAMLYDSLTWKGQEGSVKRECTRDYE